jgi:hypothetical protein
LSKLENDCLAILDYAAGIEPRCPERAGKWISIVEIAEVRCIPDSTIRNIISTSKLGLFIKYDGEQTHIHSDVFDKIAKKFRFDYKIKKMVGEDGYISWHVSAIKLSYQTPYNII